MSKIAIRVDTNKTIATGHVMRCMAVAAQLIKLGANVHVISADEGVRPFVDKTDERIYAHIMDTDWSDMESELPALIEYLRSEGIERLLVDSYQVTASYFERLREAGIHVVYMDDLCARAYSVDALINYNICAPYMGYEEMYGASTKLYLGPEYAPLRSQFAETISQNRTGIFLTTGGSDNLGIAEMIIRAILENDLVRTGLKGNVKSPVAGTESESDEIPAIYLLAGRYYEPTEYVIQAVESGKVVLHQNVDNVAKVMSTCDLAVSSAGSTLYELCAMGIPAISFAFADNQIENALGFDREGIIPYAGDFRTDREGCIRKILDFLAEYASAVRDYDAPGNSEVRTTNQSILNNYLAKRHRMQTVTDGHGAERISHIMIGRIQH